MKVRNRPKSDLDPGVTVLVEETGGLVVLEDFAARWSA